MRVSVEGRPWVAFAVAAYAFYVLVLLRSLADRVDPGWPEALWLHPVAVVVVPFAFAAVAQGAWRVVVEGRSWSTPRRRGGLAGALAVMATTGGYGAFREFVENLDRSLGTLGSEVLVFSVIGTLWPLIPVYGTALLLVGVVPGYAFGRAVERSDDGPRAED
ncbi:hypothetical protein [Halorubellus litoreus]|uniref:Uncharacterized protein n=1 Tax=Halorubellus litoreus TaxID=755308 RepID=A0ABD5VKG5_9EURY